MNLSAKLMVVTASGILFASCNSTTYQSGPDGYTIKRKTSAGTALSEGYFDRETGTFYQRDTFIPKPSKKETGKENRDENQAGFRRLIYDLNGAPIINVPKNFEGTLKVENYTVHFKGENTPQVFFTEKTGKEIELFVSIKSPFLDQEKKTFNYQVKNFPSQKQSRLNSREERRARAKLLEKTGVLAFVHVQNFPTGLSGDATLCAKPTLGTGAPLCSAVKLQDGLGKTTPILISRKQLQNWGFFEENPSPNNISITLKLDGLGKTLPGSLEHALIQSDERGIQGEIMTEFSLDPQSEAALQTKISQNRKTKEVEIATKANALSFRALESSGAQEAF